MKKRLSLLLVMVMALTMVIGTGVCAWAEPLVVAECEDNTNKLVDHFYSFEVLDSQGKVCGDLYRVNDGVVEIYHTSCLPTAFVNGVYVKGWYCCNLDGKWDTCNGPHGITPENPYASSPAATGSAHVHNFQYGVIYPATKDADGLEGEMCACGAVRNTQPISAMAYALYDYALPMINAAKPGQTITFEFGEWNSFPKAFMEKLVSKSAQGVTFVFKYKVNHELQTITIPAGTPIDLNFDWYGPAKMAELYGMN